MGVSIAVWVSVMAGAVVGVTGVVVPIEVQPTERTIKIVQIYCLSLNISISPEFRYVWDLKV
jgi:hypothetical protein